MPLLLGENDLRPLFSSADFYPNLFQVIETSLLSQEDANPGVVSWLAFPTSQEHSQINLHLLTTPVEGTSVRVFPHRIGPQANDSMFTLLFDDRDGHLLALISLDEMGPLRTSAPVAFACRYLAPQARTLAVLGSGLQARYLIRGLLHALPLLNQVRIYSPNTEHREHLVADMRAETNREFASAESSLQAMEDADVVVVAAASREPVFDSKDVQPGTLVASISARAVPRELQARAHVIVPSLIGPVHHPSGWDPFPFRLNGGREPSTVATTIVDIIRHGKKPREHEDDIVLYEQSGSFAWDGAMNRWLYNWAVEHQVGTPFSISS